MLIGPDNNSASDCLAGTGSDGYSPGVTRRAHGVKHVCAGRELEWPILGVSEQYGDGGFWNPELFHTPDTYGMRTAVMPQVFAFELCAQLESLRMPPEK